jgi:hypothetical protein
MKRHLMLISVSLSLVSRDLCPYLSQPLYGCGPSSESVSAWCCGVVVWDGPFLLLIDHRLDEQILSRVLQLF